MLRFFIRHSKYKAQDQGIDIVQCYYSILSHLYIYINSISFKEGYKALPVTNHIALM